MLLRQALEQTRAGMPPPIIFNSRMVGLEPADEVSAMEDAFDVHLHAAHNRASSNSLHHGSAGIENLSSLPHRKAATVVTGAHAS
jgi:hypothetical protein